ncbi:hypothetical protein ABT068_46865, partial [Streptomyces sp. NPDC002215]
RPARISHPTATDPTQPMSGERPDITQSSSVAISDVEAIGWTLIDRQAEGEGLQRFVNLTFRRRESGAPTA